MADTWPWHKPSTLQCRSITNQRNHYKIWSYWHLEVNFFIRRKSTMNQSLIYIENQCLLSNLLLWLGPCQKLIGNAKPWLFTGRDWGSFPGCGQLIAINVRKIGEFTLDPEPNQVFAGSCINWRVRRGWSWRMYSIRVGVRSPSHWTQRLLHSLCSLLSLVFSYSIRDEPWWRN